MMLQHINNLEDITVTLVTFVFLLTVTIIDCNQPLQTTENIVTESSFLHDIFYTTKQLNLENSTTSRTSTFIINNDEITSDHIIASELVQTTLSDLSSTYVVDDDDDDDDIGTSSKLITTPTIRPFIIPTLADYRHRITHSRPYQTKHHHEHHWGPFFEEPTLIASTGTIQINAHLGTESLLNCRVGMLRDKTVMWVRKTTDKVSLLTVGNNTHSSDPRIGVKFQYPNNWRLHINPVQKDDAGLYMCQVSTHPPRVFATNVTVLGPAIRVVDEHGHEVHDRYYKAGSTIDMTCQVAVSFLSILPTIIPGIHPYLTLIKPTIKTNTNTTNNKITSLENKNKINVTKIDYYHQKLIWLKDGEPLPKDSYVNLSSTSEWKSSRLSILQADKTHNGIYSCSILNSSTAVVNVQILSGETPAAVSVNSANRRKYFNCFFIQIFIIIHLLNISISC